MSGMFAMMVRGRIAAMFNLALCGEELTPLYRRTENPVKTFLANLQALFGKTEPPQGCSPEIAEDWQMDPADFEKDADSLPCSLLSFRMIAQSARCHSIAKSDIGLA